jgi:hypothetical protein
VTFERLIPGILGFVLVLGLSWYDGGFFAPAWGVVTLGLLGVCGCALLLRERIELPLAGVVALGALTLFTIWTLASAWWSPDITRTVLDAELVLVYPTTVAAALLVTKRDGAAPLLIGVWLGMTLICIYALAGRLTPDIVGFPSDPDAEGRLYSPLGYWNTLGGFAAMGGLLALGISASRQSPWLRAIAAASLVVFVPTAYLTFSRGAVAAGMAGLVVLFVVSPTRLRLAGTAAASVPWALGAIVGISRESALTASSPIRADVTVAGHRILPVVFVCAAGAAICALGLEALGSRLRFSPAVRRGIGASLLAALCLAAALFVESQGGPIELGRTVRGQLAAAPVGAGPSEASRLSNLSLNGRLDQWRVAWHEFRQHPIAGGGAASWELHWLREEPYFDFNANAHNLYVETLAELGIMGLALLLIGLIGAPALAIGAARRDPFGPAAAGVLAVLLVQCASDWDWQMPATTVPGLLALVSLVILGRSRAVPIPGGGTWILVGIVVMLTVISFAALQGNRLERAAGSAVVSGQDSSGVRLSDDAAAWLPWSYLPNMWRSEGLLRLGHRRAAAQSAREGLTHSGSSWRLWLDLAKSTGGATSEIALHVAQNLYPLSRELQAYCAQRPPPAGC